MQTTYISDEGLISRLYFLKVNDNNKNKLNNKKLQLNPHTPI